MEGYIGAVLSKLGDVWNAAVSVIGALLGK